tara:strand:- start:136515 stop:137810 length:1296 start_codon:yes stop_codon:yes gene_type:complete
MRLPIPFLLYVTALSLFGWAGWTVYNSLDLWKVETRTKATNQGRDDAVTLIAKGKGKGPQTSAWNYAASDWWPQLKQVNLIGKLPERKPSAEELANASKPVEPVVDLTPLDEIFELVSLVYDGEDDGKGGRSHVIIRYKLPVEPPEWWIRENTVPTTAAGAGRGPRDLAAAPATATTRRPNRNIGRNRGNGNRGSNPVTPQQPSAMPTSMAGREILQKIWVDDGGDMRRSAKLWGQYDHIQLVRVDSSAESAFFTRTVPVKEGEPVVEPKEEELLKTTADIPQDVLLSLRQLQGRDGDPKVTSKPLAKPSQWREVENTTRYGNQFHIGRKDESSFRDPDEFFSSVHVDTYVSKTSSMRGLSVRNVKSDIAQKFGVQTGDVLLEVNNRKVSSKAQAVNMVKKDYQRGVRSYSTKWLSNGQEVTRVYLAPNKK